jgi:hypothetical protein
LKDIRGEATKKKKGQDADFTWVLNLNLLAGNSSNG